MAQRQVDVQQYIRRNPYVYAWVSESDTAVRTSKGIVQATKGDFIVQDPNTGELSPMKPDRFNTFYTRVEVPTPETGQVTQEEGQTARRGRPKKNA